MIEIAINDKDMKGVPYLVRKPYRDMIPNELRTATGIMFPKGNKKYYEVEKALGQHLVKRFPAISLRDN